MRRASRGEAVIEDDRRPSFGGGPGLANPFFRGGGEKNMDLRGVIKTGAAPAFYAGTEVRLREGVI